MRQTGGDESGKRNASDEQRQGVHSVCRERRNNLRLHSGLDEGDEIGGFESGTADKTAIDILLSEETGGIGGLHGAAIEDTGCFSNVGAVEIGEEGANLRMDLLRLLIGSGFAGADCPNGLVGDDDLSHIGGGDSFEGLADLAIDHVGGLVAFAFLECFTDADDGDETGGDGGGGTLVDGFIRFAEVLAAFGVSDDDVCHAGVLEHIGGNFTGESAIGGPVDVLGTDANRGTLGGLDDGGDGEVRGADENFGEGSRRQLGDDFLHESGALSGGFVHLPVACDKNTTRHGQKRN